MDKVYHFLISLVLTVLFSSWLGRLTGTLIAAGVGIACEVYDIKKGGTLRESIGDLIADGLGIAAGLIIVSFII